MLKISLKLVLAISIDGRLAFPRGEKTNLGNKGDRKVLEEALAWSDATLMGSKTLSIHKSTCLIHNARLIKMRLHEGRPKQPICIVVGQGKNQDLDWPFFNQPIKRWLLSPKKLSSETSPPEGYESQFIMQNEWNKTLLSLKKEGISKLVILGGTELTTSLLKADVVNELQLTITPKVIGGKKTWISANEDGLPLQLSDKNSWQLQTVRTLEENEIMLRYVRRCQRNN